jgi:hypothetical protein
MSPIASSTRERADVGPRSDTSTVVRPPRPNFTPSVSSTAGSMSRREELVPPVPRRSVVAQNVDASVDLDLEWRRVADRPPNRRTAFAPEDHALTGLHGWSVAHHP